ncbi:MAG: AI-2E family transporter [Candidatus Aenigmatarchaeota archaeon]
MGDNELVVKISVILLLILSLYILWPYVSVLLFAMMLAYFSYPAYNWLRKKTTDFAAGASLTALVAVITILMVREGTRVLIREAQRLYRKLPELLANFGNLQEIEFMGYRVVQEASDTAMTRLLNYLTGLGTRIPHITFSLVIFFIGFFYFLTQGEKLYKYIRKNLPLHEDNKERVLNKVKLNVDGFIRAQILVAVIEGLIGGIIFYLLGHPYPVFFGIIIGILSLIPLLGPSLVYFPVGIYEVLKQNYLLGAAYMISGAFVMAVADYFLRPRVMGNKAKIHSFIILLGFVGGIHAFGPGGIIIGPILLSLAIILVDELKIEQEKED